MPHPPREERWRGVSYSRAVRAGDGRMREIRARADRRYRDSVNDIKQSECYVQDEWHITAGERFQAR